MKRQGDGYWYGRVLKVERVSDPNDMFFAIVKTIKHDDMLTKEEMDYLKKNHLLKKEKR